MCNGNGHPATCVCGFGGEGHLGGQRGGVRFRQEMGNTSLLDVAKRCGDTIVVQVRCKFCKRSPVFLLARPDGGFNVFESLGLPWPPHDCEERWTKEEFEKLFVGRTVDGLLLPEPKGKREKLYWYYATNSELVDDWLRRSTVEVDNRLSWVKELGLTRYRLSDRCLAKCPRELVAILSLFYDESAKPIRSVQMLRPLVNLIRRKGMFYARAALDAARVHVPSENKKGVAERLMIEWLSQERLPESPPHPRSGIDISTLAIKLAGLGRSEDED